jgi:hypothetical protein
MGNLVELFVEHLVDGAWREERPLRTPMEMDFIEVLRKKRSLIQRGMPHDVSPEVEEALGDLGEEFEDMSWATLGELRKLPFEEVIPERRLLGPVFWRERRERGAAAPLRGSCVDDGTPALLERFGARLVSNEHMDRYVESDAFTNETRGLTDGECKLFTILEVSRSLADTVGFAPTLRAMRNLGSPDAVRMLWAIGP